METELVQDIVIVGAGIAGVTTSLGLHRLGIRSLVLESSDSLRVTGFSLSIWQNAWKALDAVGVGDKLRRHHQPLNEIVTTSLVTGQQIVAIPFRPTGDQKGIEIRCVQRTTVLEVLVNELPKDTIRYSSKVVGIEESGFYKILHLADGTTIKTKLLIGCDGVNSMVAKWLGFKEASFTRRFAIRGFAQFKTHHGLKLRFMQFFGNGIRVGVVPCNEKQVHWFFTCIPTNQELKELKEDRAKLKPYVLKNIENMPSDVKACIEITDANGFLSYPLRYRQPWDLMMGNISKGNVCIGGDALHPMTPDLGQGACCALEDGVVLARCLAEAFSEEKEEEEVLYKKIEESLKKYAKERRWRSVDVTTTAYMLGSIQQAESRLVTFFRENILGTFMASQYLKKSGYDCGKLNSP
ncbi:flavoprotein monooxygenase [Vigna unguiculata]|uniref:Flavoprotein monooxygenase n=1 Tax=Vigna unguiculata TaxID=3917 RepID=A0A4D6N9U8_VIGUN|nr:flavoprotein monooxygenase [Vigna unguiculata]